MTPANDDYHISAGFGTFHEICPYKEKLERIDSLFAELEIPPPYDLWLAESIQIRERLEKRIGELKDFRDNAPQYEGSGTVEVNKRLLIQLQEIWGENETTN